MAVQKSKVTRSRRGQRRSHVTPDGYFKGRQIVRSSAVDVD